MGEWSYYNFAAESFHTKKLRSRLYSTEIEFYSTSNVTGRHRGPKRKLWAGHRARSLQRTSHAPSLQCMSDVAMRFHRRVHVFDVRASPSSPDYLCVKFRSFRGPHCWARKIAYSLNHTAYSMPREPKLSLRKNKSLFDHP